MLTVLVIGKESALFVKNRSIQLQFEILLNKFFFNKTFNFMLIKESFQVMIIYFSVKVSC